MITKGEFDVLVTIDQYKKESGKITQRFLSGKLELSVGTINVIVTSLLNNKLIDKIDKKYKVTCSGYSELEPYRVKKAIFIAAGFGSRLVPITLNTPKPLIMIHGKKIIETLLEAVIEAEINEIVIVRGYLKEQFDVLRNKYPQIKFIDNPIYNESNNISSVYFARHELKNAYILESDLLLYNNKLIRKYEYSSNYLGIPVEKTDDWCFLLKKGKINEMKIGGTFCHQMVGISYWDLEDAKKLSKDIEIIMEQPGGKELYWDQVALDKKIKEYNISLRNCKKEDIIEIDTFNELKQIDKVYDC